MTTKYLSGAYPGGYTLGAAYTGLDVEAGASVGGTGVYVAQFATVQNDGVIHATTSGYNGITLHVGGIVTNGSATDTTALIQGDSGIYCGKLESLVLANFGTISGTHRYGVVMYGGTITNGSATDTTALIDGNQKNGIWAGAPSADTVTNFGTITSAVQGIFLSAAGMVTNGSATDTTALIKGDIGIQQQNGGANIITNYGTIAGLTGGDAVFLTSKFDVLRVEAGCAFVGAVVGGYGALDLASGVGTISGMGGDSLTVSGSMAATNFSKFGDLEIASGATFHLAGAATVARYGTLDIAGALYISATSTLEDESLIDQTGTVVLRPATSAPLTITSKGTYKLDGDVGIALRTSDAPAMVDDGLLIKSAGTGMSSVAGTVQDNGIIEVATGTLSFAGKLTGTGSMKIDAGTTLQFARAVKRSLSASFNGAGGTLALDRAGAFAATIAGFAAGDTIDLIDTAATSATVNGSDQLVITNGAAAVATLQLKTYTGGTFSTGSDGHGGTAITVSGGAKAIPPVHPLVAAMAAMTVGAGAVHAPASLPHEALRPMLAAPQVVLA